MWEEVVERIKGKTREGRELRYSDGAVGITALLYCPLKHRFRQEYPDLQADAVEIDDGFVWEKQVKEVLRELFGRSFEEEKVLELEIEGLKIEGHLDTFVEFEDKVIGIELKAPKWIPLKKFVPEKLIEGNLLIDENHEYVKVNDLYITQAKIQKHLLEKLHPNRRVEQYIFLKGMAQWKGWRKKLYIVYPVYESIGEGELREMVRKFREDPSPRFPTECEGYCEYYRQGICEGKEFRYEDASYESLSPEVKELIREYRELQGQLRTVEAELKRKVRGSFRIGNRELGWVERRTEKLDEHKLAKLLPKEQIPEYFYLKWSRKKELIERFGEKIVKGVEVKREWKL